MKSLLRFRALTLAAARAQSMKLSRTQLFGALALLFVMWLVLVFRLFSPSL